MKKYSAEFLGTFVLTLFGCGSAAVLLGLVGAGGMFGIAFAFGLAIVAMFYVIGNISGCHINPAVSLAMFMHKRLSLKDFIGYVISQFAGAIAASGVLAFLFNNIKVVGNYKDIGLGANGYDTASIIGLNLTGAIVIEIILTFIFVMVVFGATSNKKTAPVAGLIIGLALTAIHIFGIPFTGTSVNPARSFGPALLMGGESLKQVWVFILAPLAGAALAALAWKLFNTEKVEILEIEEDEEGTDEVDEVIN